MALIALGMVIYRSLDRFRSEHTSFTAPIARIRLEEEWQAVVEQHESLLRQYLHAETDWDMLFNYPALIDVTVPSTSRMISAMHEAGQLSRSFPAAEITDTTNIASLQYPRAVAQFQLAWDQAEAYARKAGQSMLPAADRKTIREIRICLDMAEDPAASSQERLLAARRARSLMDSLTSLNVPLKALDAIESVQRLSIEAAAR
ncbi:hypothetical protein [Microbacterium gorillae]|uniref:hypothetical protein n=1 Tax=Microbacterium gorillae TaxID=1231063 RepID=UPI003D97C92C